MPKKERDIFDVMDEWIREIEEEFERMEKEFMRSFREIRESAKIRQFTPCVYGFRITVGLGGVPKIEEFGNVTRIKGKPIISEEREPLVDVIEKENEIKVVAEVPGVNKDNIKVRMVNGNKLIISAKSEDKQYYKEIDLPVEVDENSAKATYNNGVLVVTLQKKGSISEQGTEIKVE